MEELNQSLFLMMNASIHPNFLAVFGAKVLANYAIWVIPPVIGVYWLRGADMSKIVALASSVSGVSGLLINQIIAMAWTHPRPFMIGLGQTLIPHAADSSFPSDHLTLVWAVGVTFLLHRDFRFVGAILSLLGIAIAWARIYLGVHFPIDMLGSAFVAIVTSSLISWREHSLILPLFRLTRRLHQSLLRPFIQRGWVKT